MDVDGEITPTQNDRVRFDLRTFSECKQFKRTITDENLRRFFTPGEVITHGAVDTGFLRGHGALLKGDDMVASVAGTVEQVNKLISVNTVNYRYAGDVGDVVVGRIVALGQKRWKVDTNSRQKSLLLLSSVNLPGGELRRRSEEDERMMRHYLREGDLISAEVQQVFADGALSLHTRSLKYGKLGANGCGGTLVTVPCSLIRRSKNHFHSLPCGVSVIMGNNGYVWVAPTRETDQSTTAMTTTDNVVPETTPVTPQEREVVSRIRFCILALTSHRLQLYDTSLMHAYEATLSHSLSLLTIRKPEVTAQIINETRHLLRQQQLHY